ncbi:MAG: acetyl-CoA carboxylase carboxyltransferase subunit alpha [Calditrichota bacterium]
MNQYVLDFEKPIRDLVNKIDELEELAKNGEMGLETEIERLRRKADKLRQDIYSKLTRWQTVQLARHPHRPYAIDYISRMTTDFIELHGDRCFRDDKAIVAGLARMGSYHLAIIGHQKGHGTKDNLYRNFGMPHPEGYRKALRVMKLAEKFNLPVVTLIDTPGAYPGIGAEERGQASAIANNLFEMSKLRTPIVAVVIGEGGSGGALALGVADRVHMLRYAIYSVISPEGCASILYRDASHAQTAAEALRLTAPDLKDLGLIDDIIDEPLGGAHNAPETTAESVRQTILASLDELAGMEPEARIAARLEKYNRMGKWKTV